MHAGMTAAVPGMEALAPDMEWQLPDMRRVLSQLQNSEPYDKQ